MKKYSILFILILCLTGCKKTVSDATITGEIKGLTNDTIYLYSTDGLYDQIDTLHTQQGKFTHKLKVDTITCVMLLLDSQTEYPIFVNKGDKITVSGSSANLEQLTVNGNTLNDELTAFQQNLKGLAKPTESVLQNKAEEFIRQHHSSLVSLYLLEKYFVQKKNPDFARIKRLIEKMTGILQDQPYIEQLTNYIDEREKADIGKYAPYFSLNNSKEEKVTRVSEAFKNKYLLTHFWASWTDSTTNALAHKELKELYRTYKKNKHVGMLSISFDVDKEIWKEIIKSDTLSWEQLFDPTSIHSDLMKQFAIKELPTNILLSTDGQILARDIQGETLKKRLKSLLTEKEQKEKEQKANKKKK